MRRSLLPTEAQEQVALFQLVALHEKQYPALRWLYHTPNGGLRNVVVARKLKALGTKPGIPDLFLPLPLGPFSGLWVELKSARGTLSTAQRDWLTYLQSVGYAVAVCRSADQALAVLTGYLNGRAFVGSRLVQFDPQRKRQEAA